MIKYLALGLVDPGALPQTDTSQHNLQNAFNIFYAIIGALAIFLLVVAGLRYAINSNDQTKIAESKRMIAYTLVGLVVITMAAVIVDFVLRVK